MENGGCFATSEASKDEENLDTDGHTKQSKKMQTKTKRQKNGERERERQRERERERKEVNAVAMASSLCVEKVIAFKSVCSLELVSV